MSPAMTFLLGLWLFVGGVIATVLCVIIGWRNGFHFRKKEIQTRNPDGSTTTEQVDSTLGWMIFAAVLFMGPQAFLLGGRIVADLLYEVTETIADFWWVPLMLGVLGVTLYLVVRFIRSGDLAEGGEVRPVAPASGETRLVPLTLTPAEQAVEETWTHPEPVYTPPAYGSVPYGSFGDGGFGTPPKG